METRIQLYDMDYAAVLQFQALRIVDTMIRVSRAVREARRHQEEK